MHPLIVRHVLLPLHELALRRGTFRYLRELERSQWWSTDRLRDLQATKLRRLLAHAHARCQFHRRRIDEAGVNPATVTLDELPSLPTLTKADIVEHGDTMTDEAAQGDLLHCTTGGSTGTPLAFKVDRRRQAADQAARARTRRWFGIDIGEREVYLWGSPVEHAAQDRMKAIRDAITNHCLLNAFRMTPEVMSAYLDEIHRFDPVHVFGYPSSIARLVRHAVDCGRSIQGRSLKAVFVTGELFQPADRSIIEEHVTVPVADGYGSREGGFVAQQCPLSTYHVTMESLIVELLDPTGRTVADGEPGEIALTHLDAYGMPFIRYRTGDVARRAAKPCVCGRGLESLEIIEGRRTDMLRTTAGGFAHALSVIYVLRDEPAVKEFKVVQRPNLDLDVSIVPREPAAEGRRGAFDLARRGRVAELLKRQIGRDIGVHVHLVDEIRPDPSGKHRYVVSEVT
ncbi:MAG: phenylacetate--CoA ligase family protein [Phycisphaerae bacterium]|nr:phenylacetate--CoA ligase family protein [Phycisphaerae bacterium]